LSGLEQRECPIVLPLGKSDLYGEADPKLFRRDMHDVGAHQRPFLEFDEGEYIGHGVFECGCSSMNPRKAVDVSPAANPLPVISAG
jgi:hypothetical protein